MEQGAGTGSALRHNVVANYLGQLYTGAIGILMIPVYLNWFGAETYGLISFFALVQAFAQVLDLGLSAAVTRETARHRAVALDDAQFHRVFRVFRGIFWSLGLLLCLGLALSADALANRWLSVQQLDPVDVRHALQFMAAAVALRWVAGLYRSVVVGVDRQLWLNVFTAAIMTLRFVVVVPVIVAAHGSVVAFFVFQVLVSALELIGLWRASAKSVSWGSSRLSGSVDAVPAALRFAAAVGMATIAWVMMSHLDKLLLSSALPLADFGWFSATVSAASVVAILSIAIAQALTPRMTALAHESDRRGLLALYRQASRLAMTIGAPITLLLVALPRELLWAWTGDSVFAMRYANVLALYAAGNGLLLAAGLAYCLQYALGNLRLHVLGNVLLCAMSVPALLLVLPSFGALGAAWVWFGANVTYFLLWTPLVHRQFAPHTHWRWLLFDILGVAAPAGLVALVVTAADWSPPAGRTGTVFWCAAIFIAMVLATLPVAHWGSVARPR